MPLDTSVKHYTNTMNGAPTLVNSANAFIRLLDAVLVNGFGSQTVTSIVVSNNIATVNVSTGYNVAPYCVVNISGATPAGLNGEKKVLSSTANNILFTFDATGIADQTATGTITVNFPGAGWTKPYANTTANVAVYRNSTANGTGMYIRVVDNTTTVARIVAYETMTDADNGTNLCPTTAQFSGGIYISKNNDSNPRKWWVVADSKTFYFANATNNFTVNQLRFTTAIGDFKSNYVNDKYNFFIIGSAGDQTGGGATSLPQSPPVITPLASSGDIGVKYVMRNFSQVPGAKSFFQSYLFDDLNGLSGGGGGLVYPQIPRNTLHLSPCYIIESSCIRGTLHGLYFSSQDIRGLNYYFLDNEVVAKNDKYYLYKAIEFLASTSGPTGSDAGIFIDVSGPWT